MQRSGKTELQHYVPKILLRPHVHNRPCEQGKEQVWCYDKLKGRSFSPNLKGVASENRFNDLVRDDLLISIEPQITELEAATAPIIQSITSTRSLSSLSKKDRYTLSAFCAVQLVRTRAARDGYGHMIEGFSSALLQRGFDTSQISEFSEISINDNKAMSISDILTAPEDYAADFFDKHWYLLASSEIHPFFIGDNPLVRDNDSLLQNRSELGLRSPGISIYLPLSPTICLCMTDPKQIEILTHTYREVKRRQNKTMRSIRKLHRHDPAAADAGTSYTPVDLNKLYRENIRDLVKGGLVPYAAPSTTRANSLQVAFASRWVISSNNNFELVKEMIAGNDKFRHAPRPFVT